MTKKISIFLAALMVLTLFTAIAMAAVNGVILSHTAVPRQIQPAHWRASVMEGYWRQSIKRHMGAPGLQAFLAS